MDNMQTKQTGRAFPKFLDKGSVVIETDLLSATDDGRR